MYFAWIPDKALGVQIKMFETQGSCCPIRTPVGISNAINALSLLLTGAIWHGVESFMDNVKHRDRSGVEILVIRAPFKDCLR